MQVLVSDQVRDYVRSLPPTQKKRIREALKELEVLKGDIKDLQHPLHGYSRLRVHQFRIILKMSTESVKCIFIEKRPVVYTIFEQFILQ